MCFRAFLAGISVALEFALGYSSSFCMTGWGRMLGSGGYVGMGLAVGGDPSTLGGICVQGRRKGKLASIVVMRET